LSHLVGRLHLGNHPLVALAKGFSLSDVLLLHGRNVAQHLLLLSDYLLALRDASLLAFLDLVDNDGSTLALGLDAFDFTFFRSLEALKTLNLHHEVEALLLFGPLFFKNFVLLHLLVANSYNFTVKHQLVHELHIVLLFINLKLRLREQTRFFLLLLLLSQRWGHLVGTLPVALHHALLASSIGRLLRLKLLSVKLLGSSLILFGLNDGTLLHTVDVADNEHSGLAGGLFFCLLPDGAEVCSRNDSGSFCGGHIYNLLAQQR
jgi:hypothetical protein